MLDCGFAESAIRTQVGSAWRKLEEITSLVNGYLTAPVWQGMYEPCIQFFMIYGRVVGGRLWTERWKVYCLVITEGC